MTPEELERYSRRLRSRPGVDAALLWPFAWGAASIALVWIGKDGISDGAAERVYVNLDAIGTALIGGGLLAAGICLALFLWRRRLKSDAIARLRQSISGLEES